jgi:TrmH family RNA methyltransferase
MATITSVQNPRVKAAVRLRDHRHRQKQGRIRIDGVRELLRALEAGVPLAEVFVCEPLCRSDEARRVLAALRSSGADILEVTEAVFDKLAFGDRADGVVGIAAMPRPTLLDLTLVANPLVAVLEGVEKPGNVGAVLRTGDAAGLSALIVADGRTDLFNPNAIRASLGTIFTVPVCTATARETLDWLRGHDLAIHAARVNGSVLYTEADYTRPTAIILGSEAEGLTAVWTGDDVTSIRLPMLGTADSLNVAATAAVLFYEALRQRTGEAGFRR